MPPRVPIPATSAAPSLIRTSANVTLCLAQPSPLSRVSGGTTAGFSSTAARPLWTKKLSKSRLAFIKWQKTEGKQFRVHNQNHPQYLVDPKKQRIRVSRDSEKDAEETEAPTHVTEFQYRPFPDNSQFLAPKVLSEETRELIWTKVMRDGETLKGISAELGVDIRRVAAVVRLKEVEKEWEAKNKPLAKLYAEAVMKMLPRWRYSEGTTAPFEPINEVHVHPYSMQQIFWPTSESRQFTREDAAKALHPTLLSADKRIPHPELVQMEKDILDGRTPWEASERFKQAAMESERAAAEKHAAKLQREERLTTRVDTARFQFRFKEYNAENVGPNGKARGAVGWRYGAPLDDRAKGQQNKIPTSVP